ncbi:MAG: hypothetical protein AAGK32_21485, partial [Actinomycetota bacterium]
MKLKTLIAVLAVFALVAAACGDNDDDTGTSGGGGESSGATIDIDGILSNDLENCEEAPTGDPIKVGMAMDFSDVVGFVDIPGTRLE